MASLPHPPPPLTPSQLARRLRRPDAANPPGGALAAVALLLRGFPRPEVLLIRRAIHPPDPWSGQVALPGGRMEPADAGPSHTAAREVREELGLELAGPARELGWLPGAVPIPAPALTVVPVVYHLREEVRLRPNAEVDTWFWAELSSISDPALRIEHAHALPGGAITRHEAVRLGPHLLWGLTLRILTGLLETTAS